MSEPIVSDINKFMIDYERYDNYTNLYISFTESVWNTSELVFKCAHKALSSRFGLALDLGNERCGLGDDSTYIGFGIVGFDILMLGQTNSIVTSTWA